MFSLRLRKSRGLAGNWAEPSASLAASKGNDLLQRLALLLRPSDRVARVDRFGLVAGVMDVATDLGMPAPSGRVGQKVG